ncbi:tetratricopeptide repeat protein [Elusimicrobiota bacterium]
MKPAFILIMILAAYPCQALYAQVAGKVNRANSLYRKEKYDESEELYKKALEKKEKDRIYYNIGNNYLKKKDYENAEENYKKAAETKDLKLKQKINHNLGNLYYEQGKLNEAVESWKNSLVINPGDQDTRHNLEMGLKLIKEQEEQQSQQDDKDKKNNDEENKDKNKDGEKEKEEREKEEAKRMLNIMDDMEKKAREKKKFEMPKINVEQDW